MLNSKKNIRQLFTTFLLLIIALKVQASHIMGGTISYECQGNGNYIFQLVFYRDCNGAPVNTNALNLRIWNHPALSTIPVQYIATEDISPQGNVVAGGAPCFNCDEVNGNIGIGSIERIVYRSASINIGGVPPAQGWVITYDDFSRNSNITNLLTPTNYGITLTAKIFNVGATNNICTDNSPIFLQNPHFVSCVGKPFKLNLNPVDPDLDSLDIQFDLPLNNLNNQPYQEGVNPIAVPFVNGFGLTNPTPSATQAPGSIATQVDPLSGEISFLSTIAGNFNVKIKVRSFRNGQLISEVVHEMQLVVTNCLSTNNPPVATGPFGGGYTTNVIAGDVVNFTFSTSDVELLQDGSPQTNSIEMTGLLFGPNPTVATGCLNGPCPTIQATQPITGVQGASVTFNWQTDCSHLLDANNNELDIVPYQFVVRAQDNFCPIPEVIFETITINVTNPNVIQAPPISCIQGSGTSDFIINWPAVADVNNSFVRYEIHTVQNGLIATIPAINTTSYTHTGVTTNLDYFIAVVSGCNGQAFRYSDTISNIFLNVSNLALGTAVLDWSNPTTPALASFGAYYYIHREFPAGTWSIIDSVPYGTTHYEQIIDICSQHLNYQVSLNNTTCNYLSQINGAMFTDQTPPSIPSIVNVTIDTLTNETTINWNATPEPDTYGYIVYIQDPITGFLVELDTIFGRLNASYTYMEDYVGGALTYTVAAFDSCPSPTGAPFNLSARDPNFHTTVYLTSTLTACDGIVEMNWTNYGGWVPTAYEVYLRENGGAWSLASTINGNSYTFNGNDQQNYDVAVKALGPNGVISFSNVVDFIVSTQSVPSFSYIQFASVNTGDESINLSYIFDQTSPIQSLVLQKWSVDGFQTIFETNNPTSPLEYEDTDVYPDNYFYTYRVQFVDVCGNLSTFSNTARTMLLKTQLDAASENAYLNWTPYTTFNGNVIGYNVYRSIDGVWEQTPIAMLTANILSYVDPLYDVVSKGLVCYKVEAIEGPNVYGNPRTSVSNDACVTIEPLIYVPNAFYPEGVNKIFIPVLRNHDVTRYRMTVLNRWGQVVFQTQDVHEGWNGQLDNQGVWAQPGVYIYMIEMYDGNGEQVMTRGHVTLLK